MPKMPDMVPIVTIKAAKRQGDSMGSETRSSDKKTAPSCKGTNRRGSQRYNLCPGMGAFASRAPNTASPMRKTKTRHGGAVKDHDVVHSQANCRNRNGRQ